MKRTDDSVLLNRMGVEESDDILRGLRLIAGLLAWEEEHVVDY